MQRIHRISFVVPHEPYRLQKKFRHDQEHGREPVKWHKNIYNKDMGEIFGSTPLRWLTRIIYYLCLYAGICVLWCICYVIFNETLSETEPNRHNFEAPGMAMAPHISASTYPTIEFRERKDIDIDDYTDAIDTFLSKFGALSEDFGECTADKEYGYMDSKPCIFLKVNRMIGFTPQTYDSEAELPIDAPDDLKALVGGLNETDRTNRVWLSCTAQRQGMTKLEYWPKHQSVPAELLTVNKVETGKALYSSDDYKRIVAVQISEFDIGENFKVDCFTWAKNIPQLIDGYSNRGFLRFGIHIKKGLLFSYD